MCDSNSHDNECGHQSEQNISMKNQSVSQAVRCLFRDTVKRKTENCSVCLKMKKTAGLKTDQGSDYSSNEPCDMDFVAAQNLVQIIATEQKTQGDRTEELLLALKKTTENEANQANLVKTRVMDYVDLFHLSSKNKTVEKLAEELAEILLEDINRDVPGENKTLEALAPPERKMVWNNLGVLPAGQYYEMIQALHQVTNDDQNDWRKVMDDFFRLGITLSINSVGGGTIAQDCLFNLPRRTDTNINLGALKTESVNIVIHSCTFEMASQIIEATRSEIFTKMAEQMGAKGIQLYAVGSSDPSSLKSLDSIIPLSDESLSQIVIATGAIDLWLADTQNIFPDTIEIAHCYNTAVVTTDKSNSLPGVECIDSQCDQEEIEACRKRADKIITRALESYKKRSEVKRADFPHTIEAMLGFNLESLKQRFGSMSPIASALNTGKIKGIVNFVGCLNLSEHFEKKLTDIVDILLANNILVFASGCASLPLMEKGYCSTNALDKCGEELQKYLNGKFPPVWHFSHCVDDVHLMLLFREIAKYVGHPVKKLPLAELTLEFSKEKEFCSALFSRMIGINSYHCTSVPVYGAKKVQELLCDGTKELFGSSMIVEAEPKKLAEKIVTDIDTARSNICWR
ncbi:hypothetical protein [Desulfovibrio inopinatus]|uniref:hypothetical protein n=1 Tax=Desulfovibrio inopinatus TaxID=102109 RepID=UPI0006849368|nr:hypothetical protein [Desulfovibrio inopinatus]